MSLSLSLSSTDVVQVEDQVLSPVFTSGQLQCHGSESSYTLRSNTGTSSEEEISHRLSLCSHVSLNALSNFPVFFSSWSSPGGMFMFWADSLALFLLDFCFCFLCLFCFNCKTVPWENVCLNKTGVCRHPVLPCVRTCLFTGRVKWVYRFMLPSFRSCEI